MSIDDQESSLILRLLLLAMTGRGRIPSSVRQEIVHTLQRDLESSRAIGDLRYPARFLLDYILTDDELALPLMEGDEDAIDAIYGRMARRLDRETEYLHDRSLHLEKYLEYSTNISEKNERDINGIGDSPFLIEWGLSLGLSFEDLKIKRAVPIRIYISEDKHDHEVKPLVDAIQLAVEQLGFVIAYDLPSEGGSWWKRLWLRSREALSQDEMQERLTKLERAAETRLLDKPQAEANRDHAAAVESVMNGLKDVESGCVQVGNLLLVKITKNGKGSVVARTLTVPEMKAIERNQTMLRNPAKIIELLQKECQAGVGEIRPQSIG